MPKEKRVTVFDRLSYIHQMPTSRKADVTSVRIDYNSADKSECTIRGVNIDIGGDNDKNELYKLLNASGSDYTLVQSGESPYSLKKLTIICCNDLTLKKHLGLPECDVTIFARRVIFGYYSLCTTPLPWANSRAPDCDPVSKRAGSRGQNGHKGGNVTIYAEEIFYDGYPGKAKTSKIITNGGYGQRGGSGKDGARGRDVSHLYSPQTTIKYSFLDQYVNVTFKHEVTCVKYTWTGLGVIKNTVIEGQELTPTDGEDAIAPGASGDAGPPGQVKITTIGHPTDPKTAASIRGNLASLVESEPGEPGYAAPKCWGGDLDTPRPLRSTNASSITMHG